MSFNFELCKNVDADQTIDSLSIYTHFLCPLTTIIYCISHDNFEFCHEYGEQPRSYSIPRHPTSFGVSIFQSVILVILLNILIEL